MQRSPLLGLAPLLILSTLASGQTAVVADETFDFGSVGTPIGGTGSGSGWAGPWDAGPGMNYGELASPSFDPTGLRVHLTQSVAPTFRDLDVGAHPDIADAGRYGADDSTLWIRFQIQEVTGTAVGQHFGGVSLFDGPTEELFMGSPWGSLQWGIDDHNGGLYPIAGSSVFSRSTLVSRLDFMPGDERIRMWLDPATPYPTGVADIDITVPNFRFDRLRIDNAGGSGGDLARYDLDAIAIEKVLPPLGTNYCNASANSTGSPAVMSAAGTPVVAMNDVTLSCEEMPLNAFGFFLTSQASAFVMNPGGSSGNLCLGGSIGRFVGPGQVQSTGTVGTISLGLDLGQQPTPNGLVQVQGGQTWFFQCWYRDAVGGVATSNFSDGLEVDFL